MIHAVALRYLGARYEELDCYELLRAVYREAFGVELPKVEAALVADDAARAEAIEAAREGEYWTAVAWDRAEPGDVVLLRSARGAPTHLAILLAGERILHSVPGRGVVVDRFDRRSPWRRLALGVYRWNGRSASGDS